MDTITSHQASLSEILKSPTNFMDPNIDDHDHEQSQHRGISGYQIENVVLLDPDSSLTPEEKVFSIDHVFELILHYLDKTSLLTFRFVSRRWAYFAAKNLQRTVHLSFFAPHNQDPSGAYFVLFESNSERQRPFQDMVDLMNHSPEFPCTSFYFFGATSKIVTPALEPFVRSQGARLIKKLKLGGLFSTQDITHVICTHALNLNCLKLTGVKFRKNVKSKSGNALVSLGGNPLTGSGSILKNLKIFKCDNPIPENIIHQILESFPNLSLVFLHQQNLHCLVKPTNRLHLLMKLVIRVTGEDTILLLKLIADNLPPHNLKVQQIQLSGLDKHFEAPSQNLVDAMTKILKSCSGTCTKLVWYNLLENFRIPLMSQIRHVTLRIKKNPNGSQRYIFQEGACLQNTFPNLQYLIILSGYVDLSDIPTTKILSKYDHPLSVSNEKDFKFCVRIIRHSFFESFREIFLNANVHT